MSKINLPKEKKCRLLAGAGALTTTGCEEIGLPAINMSDGPYGIRRLIGHPFWPQDCKIEGGDVCYPTPSALGSTWNIDLVRRVGAAIAEDCIEEDVQVLLAPGVNMKRTPACGRNFEYYSEDPVLSGELGAAFIQGVQSRGISACLKHFAANNQEMNRNGISVEIDERTLRELYLLPFEIAVKKGQPDSVMCAYNKLGSIWCSEHRWLLTELLRNEWNYDGLVVSDWCAVHSPAKALAAGLDLQMPENERIYDMMKYGLENGIIDEERLDDAINRIRQFSVKASESKNLKRNYNRSKLHELAQEAARESIVLLKNENAVLPIQKESVKSIAVFGMLAEKPVIMGGGSSKVTVEEKSIDVPLECIRTMCGEDISLTYCPVYTDLTQYTDVLNQVRETASKVDLSIVFIGNVQDYETEGDDRRFLDFPEFMARCAEVASYHCKKSVVVMMTGSCTKPGGWWEDHADGIIQMWYSGEGGGQALADIMFGVTNPSGKLSESFFKEEPEYTRDFGTGRHVTYKEGPFIGYRYYDKYPNKLKYPFGFGLSYTNYEYTDAIVSNADMSKCEDVEVQFTIKNIGNMAGQEIWQVYVSQHDSMARKPEKELKRFGKIQLGIGEVQKVSVVLNKRDFSYYNPYLHEWTVENGKYLIHIAASSRDIRHTVEININDDKSYTIICEHEAIIL